MLGWSPRIFKRQLGSSGYFLQGGLSIVLGGRREVVIAARNISLRLPQISFSTDNWADIHLLDAHEYFPIFLW
jgi:hypothetical protein